MDMVTVRLLGLLKNTVNKEYIELDIDEKETTLKQLLKILREQYEELSIAIDEKYRLKPGFLAFINDIDYMVLEKENTKIKNSDVIVLMPISHGG